MTGQFRPETFWPYNLDGAGEFAAACSRSDCLSIEPVYVTSNRIQRLCEGRMAEVLMAIEDHGAIGPMTRPPGAGLLVSVPCFNVPYINATKTVEKMLRSLHYSLPSPEIVADENGSTGSSQAVVESKT